MANSRQVRVWGLVAATAASRGMPVSAADACAAVVTAVEVSGAWLTAAVGWDAGHVMDVTDGTSEVLAELELTLGEGPSRDAIDSGGPALASDLSTGGGSALAGFCSGGTAGRGGSSLCVPAADRRDPGGCHGTVPGSPRPAERLPSG